MKNARKKSKKNRMTKSQKSSEHASNHKERGGSGTTVDSPSDDDGPPSYRHTAAKTHYPFPTDYNDHFETPDTAYRDILPLLESALDERATQRRWGRPTRREEEGRFYEYDGADDRHDEESKGAGVGETVLYDPYFCTGRAANLLRRACTDYRNGDNAGKPSRHFKRLRIAHEKRDYYRDVEDNTVPQHDALITNPPYSGNHKERCLEYAVENLRRNGRPFFLLMPNYVAMKGYYRQLVLDGDWKETHLKGSVGGKGPDDKKNEKIRVMYVCNQLDPYEYDHPEGTGHDTSPFSSVWFCGMACVNDEEWGDILRRVKETCRINHEMLERNSASTAPAIAESLDELIRIGAVSAERRENPRQRKKRRQRAAMVIANSETNTMKAAGNSTADATEALLGNANIRGRMITTTGRTGERRDSGKKKKQSLHRDSDGVRKKRRF